MINSTIENPGPDTVQIYYPFTGEETFDNCLPILSIHLEQSEIRRNNSTKELIFIGRIRNMKVTVASHGISLNGSLCTYHNGNNYKSLTRNQTMLCILSLQIALGIPLHNAIVRRLDFGCCLIMDAKPESYFNGLGICGKYERLQRDHSVYYLTGYKCLVFYNKYSEMKYRKHSDLPEQIHSNTLRYEIRLKRKLSQQLNREKIFVKDLYDESFYKDMIVLWANEFARIHKNGLVIPINNNLTCNDGILYTLSLLMILQGINNVTRLIDALKDNFTQGSYARYQKKLKSLKFLSKESELIAELNTKISRIKENALIIASDEG
jgi:hypothetical protein